MPTQELVQNVRPDYAEYAMGMYVTASGDVLEIEFNEPFMLEEIVTSSSNDYKVELVYPMSGVTCQLRAEESGNFQLNAWNAHKKWYRVPARTKFRLTVGAFSTSELVEVSLLGRPQ